MKFLLKIDCDSEPFTDESGDDEPRALEVARILEDLAERVRSSAAIGLETVFTLTDANEEEVGLANFAE